MKIVKIGRDHSNDIIIDDPLVSRNHLTIIQDDKGNFKLLDVGSKNGTFVNGNRVQQCDLNLNDIIRIGNNVLPWRNYFLEQDPSPAEPETPEVKYAGFWLRFVAYMIDSFILGILYGIYFLIVNIFIFYEVYPFLIFMIPFVLFSSWLYFSIMESSKAQATIGKMALSLKVTDMEGNRISFGRATGRFFGKFISEIILMIGFMMAGWTEKKQALHDMMADTLVIRLN